jgi:hypothetical protein
MRSCQLYIVESRRYERSTRDSTLSRSLCFFCRICVKRVQFDDFVAQHQQAYCQTLSPLSSKGQSTAALIVAAPILNTPPRVDSPVPSNRAASDCLSKLSSFRQIAHDWGGAVAWHFVRSYPHLVSRLVTLNIPETSTFGEALKNNKEQRKKSWYIGERKSRTRAGASL